MTDRELLELAAKAVFFEFGSQMLESGWNPLEDDGDALRLAVRLHIDLSFCGATTVCNGKLGYLSDEVDPIGDQLAATRRAIVRAAAAMAKEEGK